MRKTASIALTLAILFTSASAFAQNEDARPTQFVDMTGMIVDGKVKTPDVMGAKTRKGADFSRLARLKKSFLPRVIETAEDAALR